MWVEALCAVSRYVVVALSKGSCLLCLGVAWCGAVKCCLVRQSVAYVCVLDTVSYFQIWYCLVGLKIRWLAVLETRLTNGRFGTGFV